MYQELLSEKQAARKLKVDPSTLRNWRYYGRGPTFEKIGYGVYYRREVIKVFAATYSKVPKKT